MRLVLGFQFNFSPTSIIPSTLVYLLQMITFSSWKELHVGSAHKSLHVRVTREFPGLLAIYHPAIYWNGVLSPPHIPPPSMHSLHLVLIGMGWSSGQASGTGNLIHAQKCSLITLHFTSLALGVQLPQCRGYIIMTWRHKNPPLV